MSATSKTTVHAPVLQRAKSAQSHEGRTYLLGREIVKIYMFCSTESSGINIYFGCTSGRNVERVMFLLKANVSFLRKSLASAWFDITVGPLELLWCLMRVIHHVAWSMKFPARVL